MRILIISDIHANFVALETVLAAAKGRYDSVWCLGDTIGYGPRPNECADVIRETAAAAISGNHDLACIGDPEADLDFFNYDARTANEWNGKQLTDENRTWLRNLSPRTAYEHPALPAPGAVLLAHGSPRNPIWEYLLYSDDALANFQNEAFPQQMCFIGHSHVPIYFRLADHDFCEMILPTRDKQMMLRLLPDERYIINPGSVGQPRDQDPRAAYAIYDVEDRKIMFYRVEYDIPTTQKQMRDAGLPRSLIRRLDYGL